MFRSFLTVIFCITLSGFQLKGQINASLDSSILDSDYLILGQVISDTSWDPPEGVFGKWHAVDVVIKEQCIADWKEVKTRELRKVGDTLKSLKYFTDTYETLKIDSIYFMPIRIRGNQFVFFMDHPLHMEVVTNTNLYPEYCERRNPSSHISFPIYKQEKHGKWDRTYEYTSDSLLVSIKDERENKGKTLVRHIRYYEYDSTGKLNTRYRYRYKQRGFRSGTRQIFTKMEGRSCFRIYTDRSY